MLRSHVVSWSGDTSSVTKLMYLTEHNLYKECHFCNIRDIYANHIYFLTLLPMEKEDQYETYDPNNLPLRTHEQFKDQIFRLKMASSEREKAELVSEFSVFRFVNASLLIVFN